MRALIAQSEDDIQRIESLDKNVTLDSKKKYMTYKNVTLDSKKEMGYLILSFVDVEIHNFILYIKWIENKNLKRLQNHHLCHKH